MQFWEGLMHEFALGLATAGRFVRMVAAFALLGCLALAQVGGITPDQLQQLQQQRGNNTATQPTVTPRETILEPTAPSAPLTTSPLEQLLSLRAGVRLQQYGYDQLGVGRAVTLSQVGAVQDSYVLGVGDEVVLTLRGQENNEYRAQVDRDGNVTFPRLNPMAAAGRNFGRFRQDLAAAIHRSYVSTEGFVTVGRMRQISVLVSGEVGSPGVRTLTGLSSVVDAIFVSGGIKKSGSLRNIRIVNAGRERTVDLYAILLGKASSSNASLADGDKIVVPSIGATVAVAGDVRRPGIYELPAGRHAISVREAVSMASGMTVPGSYLVSQLRTMPDGKRQFIDVTGGTDSTLSDGEIVFVRTSVNVSINQVMLAGAFRTPGAVALGKFKTIHDVLPSIDALKPGAYLLFGIVERTDPVTLERSAIPFSPRAVIQGKTNFALYSDDTVRVLTKRGMRDLAKVLVAPKRANSTRDNKQDNVPDNRQDNRLDPRQDNRADNRQDNALDNRQDPRRDTRLDSQQDQTDLGTELPLRPNARNPLQPNQPNGATNPPGDAAMGVDPGAYAASSAGQRGIDAGGPSRSSAALAAASEANSELAALSDLVASFGKKLGDYRVTLSGAVHEPGVYLVFPETPIADLLVAAGGLTDDVDLSAFEITSTNIDNAAGTSVTERKQYPATNDVFASTLLKPFDRLVFHTVYSDRNTGSVMVSGEVRYPGNFDILRGEKLSSVLRRAGGYTETAYPEGAVFQRESIAKLEQQENVRMVADMRSQLLAFVMKPPSPNGGQTASADTIKAVEALLVQIASVPTLGRVPVVASLQSLEKHPELDTTLEPGDTLVVPKRPATVLVVGEVQRTGAQRYDPSATSDDYINLAGGTTGTADTSRIIVVLPDGSVRSNDNSWLDFGSDSRIPPGSTIYVPRKLEIYEFRQFLTDTIQIVSQLATTAAALAVLSKQ